MLAVGQNCEKLVCTIFVWAIRHARAYRSLSRRCGDKSPPFCSVVFCTYIASDCGRDSRDHGISLAFFHKVTME